MQWSQQILDIENRVVASFATWQATLVSAAGDPRLRFEDM